MGTMRSTGWFTPAGALIARVQESERPAPPDTHHDRFVTTTPRQTRHVETALLWVAFMALALGVVAVVRARR